MANEPYTTAPRLPDGPTQEWSSQWLPLPYPHSIADLHLVVLNKALKVLLLIYTCLCVGSSEEREREKERKKNKMHLKIVEFIARLRLSL